MDERSQTYRGKASINYSTSKLQFTSKYKLKSQQLHAIYLLIQFKASTESLFRYEEYFNIISDNYSAVAAYSSNLNISNLIRVWLLVITYPNSI